MVHVLLTTGIFLYGAIMLWIIVPSGPLPCQTTVPSQLIQPNITLGSWQVEFISERFCQCYESDNHFLRTLPLLAAACMLAVLLLLVYLDSVYRHRLQDETDQKDKPHCIICFPVQVHQLPKPARHALVVIAMLAYVVLTLFTHRPVYGFRPFNVNTASVDAHYISTSLFFACFTLLYANAVVDFNWLSNKRSWVLWFHVTALGGIFLLSLLFALFAVVIERNGAMAILFEYILFGWILLTVPIWLFCLDLRPKSVVQWAGDKHQNYTKLSIYDLNINIL
jgi:hypothetical protein